MWKPSVRLRVLAFCLLTATLQHASCYNIDTLVPTVKSGPSKSAFGLQVVPFRDKDNNTMLLVGAPLAKSSSLGKQVGIVYRCPLLGSCTEIDGLHDNSRDRNTTTEHQLMGQTVMMSLTNDNFPKIGAVVCAPLYREYFAKKRTFLPLGRCFTLDSGLGSPEAFYPWGGFENTFRSEKHDDPHDLFMAGQSGTLSQQLAIGAPGAFNMRGTVMNIDISDISAASEFGRKSYIGLEQYTAVNRRTPDQDTYLGYSLANGRITKPLSKTKKKNDYVVGEPRGNNMRGQVVVMEVKLTGVLDRSRDIQGDQVGSYMGHTVCVVNLNDDDYDDFIIGAPYYATYGSYGSNEGRMYVYRVMNKRQHADPLIFNGMERDGLFGFAIAAVGDINQDGLPDVAVGAPGELQRIGRVYIYFGNRDNILKGPAQIIDGTSVSSGVNPSFFGYTLSGGIDIDNNFYPDVVVGSFASDKVWVLRSRPIIKVFAVLDFSPKVIDLDKQFCSWNFSKNVTCFQGYVSLWYESKHPEIPPPAVAVVGFSLTLDFTHPSQFRLRFNDNSHIYRNAVTLRAGQNKTLNPTVYVTPTIKDKQSPFRVKFSYYEPEVYMEPRSSVTGKLPVLYPSIDNDTLRSEHVASFTVQPKSLCVEADGDDNCNPDLVPRVWVTYINNGTDLLDDVNFIAAGGFRSGKRPVLVVHIVIENKGEAAYGAKLVVTLPNGLQFQRATIKRQKEDITSVSCAPREVIHAGFVGDSHIDCDIGNPMRSGAKEEFELYLINSFVGDEDEMKISLNATSTGEELSNNMDDNFQFVFFNVKAYATLVGVGAFFPPGVRVSYETDARKVKWPVLTAAELGPNVSHKYTIKNNGPSVINSLNISIVWPMYNQNMQDLLYLYALNIPGFDTRQCEADNSDVINRDGYPHNATTRREKRAAVTDLPRLYNADGCDVNYCVAINCILNVPIQANQVITVILNATVVEKTFVNYTEAPPTVASRLEARILSDYFHQSDVFSATVYSRLQPDEFVEYFDCVPFWVIIASVIGGVVILAIIILVLCFVGFFKMGQSGSMSVSANRDLQWKTAVPVSQTPVGTLATESHAAAAQRSTSHEDELSPADNVEMDEFDGSNRQSKKSMSVESDNSVKKETPMNGDGQSTV